MLKVGAIEKVHHTCTLSNEDEQKVLDYIKNNEEEFELMSSKDKIISAVEKLYSEDEIDLYGNSTESESSTEEINWSEFEEKEPDDFFNN